MAFHWGADDGPTLTLGFSGDLEETKKPYIFVIFQGGGGGGGGSGPSVLPSGSTHATVVQTHLWV